MARRIRFANRAFHLPDSRLLRLVIGVLLVVGGALGFLPVLGFWMIPLGLLVLSIDIPAIRRRRRKLAVWWYRRKGRPSAAERNGRPKPPELSPSKPGKPEPSTPNPAASPASPQPSASEETSRKSTPEETEKKPRP